MLRTLLLSSLLVSVSARDSLYSRCNCYEEGIWSAEDILECQKVSDFLIAVAYFSIPIELLYFISCSTVPFKWVLFQFISFIVLCGLTHLFNGLTYGPHSFQIVLLVTIFKLLTALVSCATSITLFILIPLLLKVKVREFLLKKKARDLGREVGIIKKQKEIGSHVRMLTQEIRKSLDRHTILYTTMVELYKELDLLGCAIWMPNENKTEVILTHELKERNFSDIRNLSIPISDPDVVRIKGSDSVNILRSDSSLLTSNGENSSEPGAVAAIRVPMLRFSSFKGGTQEHMQTYYSILVLILPDVNTRSWTNQELEIIRAVSDQVAVALSHAAVLEESQFMRERLEAQNYALQLAKKRVMMACQVKDLFQKAIRRPMHSVAGSLSMIQDGDLSDEQILIVDTMVKTSRVLSSMMDEVMDISTKDKPKFPFEMRPFRLHSFVKEAACLARCLAVSSGLGFTVEVERSLPNHVFGDERRIFQIILYMFGDLLNGNGRGGNLKIWVSSEIGSGVNSDQRWATWDLSSKDRSVNIKFEMMVRRGSSQSLNSVSTVHRIDGNRNSGKIQNVLCFGICKKLVELMEGNIWAIPNPEGCSQSMGFVLPIHILSSNEIATPESAHHSNSIFSGVQILVADDHDANRAVTQKLLEKLGCEVSSVSSGFECLRALGPSGSSIEVVILDLEMQELDGYEVAKRICKIRNRPLIIALNVIVDDRTMEACLEIGINGIIRKPVFMQGIADELRRVLCSANLRR